MAGPSLRRLIGPPQPIPSIRQIDLPDHEKGDPQDAPYASDVSIRDDKIDALFSELVNRSRRVKPVPFRTQGLNKQTPAGPLTFNFMDLGGPPAPHRIWNVLRFAVWGIDPFTATTGQVLAFIDTKAPQDSNTEPIFASLLDLATNIPGINTWDGHQVTLRFGEHLILGFKGVPAATQLYAEMQGEEEDLADFRIDRD